MEYRSSLSFLFATLKEAEETIRLFAAKQKTEHLWIFPQGEVVVTGMGRENVYQNTHASSPLWINLGIAGAFSKKFRVRERVWIKSVSEYPLLDNVLVLIPESSYHLDRVKAPEVERSQIRSDYKYGPNLRSPNPGALTRPSERNFREIALELELEGKGEGEHLYSALFPVYEKPDEVQEVSLVDMEGYFFAKVAAQRGARLLMGKVISDHCSKNTSDLIKSRLPMLSKQLASFALSILNTRHAGSLMSCH